MNLVMGAPLWLTVLLCLALVAAAVEDAVRLRISNITCLAVLITAVLAMATHGFSASLWQNGLVFALLLIIGTFAFAAKLLGGGDVKLLAATGAWMSLTGAMWLIAAVFIAGGVIAVCFIATRRLRSHAGGPSERVQDSRIPYGLAIVAGALLVFAAQLGVMDRTVHKPTAFPLPALRK
jgi:prepilin peptidase CpaA